MKKKNHKGASLAKPRVATLRGSASPRSSEDGGTKPTPHRLRALAQAQQGDSILVHFQGWFGRKTRRAVVLNETAKRYRVQYEGETASHLVPKYAVTLNTNG